MKEHLRGFSKIFSFTFLQHVKSKGYRNGTIVIALICLILPALIMTLTEDGSRPEPVDYAETEVQTEARIMDIGSIRQVFAVDLCRQKKVNLSGLPDLVRNASGTEIQVADYGDDIQRALDDSRGSDDTVLIVTEQKGSEYTMRIVAPDGSDALDNTYEFQNILNMYADGMTVAAGGEPVYYKSGSGEEDSMEGIQEMVSMIFSYLNIMVLYFFVLIYGQGVANSVVMEKSSKLMETLLVSVRPAAVIMGKLFAIVAAGLLELFSWVFSLAISFAAGTAIVRNMNPETDMMIIQVFSFLKQLTEGMFSLPNCLLAILVVISGILLYCALAGVGGSMANKPEDLSSANVIFTLVLIASFFALIFGGGMEGNVNPWFDWIPFTSVMITPARAMLGMLPVWKTLCSLAVTMITTGAMVFCAGKIYEALVLYKGESLNPSTLIKALRGNTKRHAVKDLKRGM